MINAANRYTNQRGVPLDENFFLFPLFGGREVFLFFKEVELRLLCSLLTPATGASLAIKIFLLYLVKQQYIPFSLINKKERILDDQQESDKRSLKENGLSQKLLAIAD